MNRCHDYDDELNNPPPPPWWQGPLVTLGFILALIAAVAFLTSCTCTCGFDVSAAVKAIPIILGK